MKFHYTTTKTMLSREQSALKSWHTHTHTLSHLLTCCHLAHYSRRQLPTQRVRHTYKWRWQGKNRHPLISKRTSVDACVQMEPPNTPRSQPNERTNERTNERREQQQTNAKVKWKQANDRRTTSDSTNAFTSRTGRHFFIWRIPLHTQSCVAASVSVPDTVICHSHWRPSNSHTIPTHWDAVAHLH